MFARQIGIDLGTANVIVYVRGKGIVLTEPSVVALAKENGSNRPRIVAVGEEARLMLGRTPGTITALRPMRDGVIADYVITEEMLRHFINKVAGRIRIFHPELMICVPSGVTSVERRAVKDAAVRAGAREAHLIEEPLAAAIGANIPISGPSGNLIIDIGGGTAEIAVISLGGIVVSRSVRAAGNKLDEAIASFVRKRYNLMIGERTAEDVKIQIGSALPMDPELTMEVRGRDLIAGLPRTITIGSNEITEAMDPILQQIIAAVKSVLEETPPELASDVIDKGMVLSGGGALLRNMDKLLTQVTGVACYVAENPLYCVAKGTGLGGHADEALPLRRRMAAGSEAAFDEAVLQGTGRGLRAICDAHAFAPGERGGAHDLERGAGSVEHRNDAATDTRPAGVDGGAACKRAGERGNCGEPRHDLKAAPWGQTRRV